jgi:hypothetical protein
MAWNDTVTQKMRQILVGVCATILIVSICIWQSFSSGSNNQPQSKQDGNQAKNIDADQSVMDSKLPVSYGWRAIEVPAGNCLSEKVFSYETVIHPKENHKYHLVYRRYDRQSKVQIVPDGRMDQAADISTFSGSTIAAEYIQFRGQQGWVCVGYELDSYQSSTPTDIQLAFMASHPH